MNGKSGVRSLTGPGGPREGTGSLASTSWLLALPPLSDPRLPWLLVAVLVLLLAVAVWAWRRARTRVGRANRRRLRVAQAAESAAEKLLARAGFVVLERQVLARWRLEVGGREVEVASRADLLVARRGRVYVADVKTGAESPDPRLPATRRQLLEYLLAFDADGALVVDMVSGEVVEVAFPGLLRDA